ncbi:MAG: NAD-dependent epimerase/dehydratase family protein [Gemmatimonadaceae bacterium]|nr:NAD-dependent epimerase/dehydratase family protein [Gemmatimonadaceae bacterium]
MKKVVVTGAGGFIGRALVASLARHEGMSVVAADNNFRGSLETVAHAPSVSTVRCDVLDMAAVSELCQGADLVFHLAAINGTKNFYEAPAAVLEVGIIGTHNVLKASLRHGVRRVIFMSSSEVYNVPDVIPTPEAVRCIVPDVYNARFSYGGGKIAGELMTVNYLRGTGTEFMIIRPHNVYGPQMGRDHVVPELIRKIRDAGGEDAGGAPLRIHIQGTGEETRAFIFIDDAVRAIELCAFHGAPNTTYNIGTDQEVSVKTLVAELGVALSRDVQVAPAELLLGSTPRRCPDTSKIAALGFRPEISLREGIARTARWYWQDLASPGA